LTHATPPLRLNEARHSTWFVALVAFFVTSLIVSNVAAVKPVQLLGLTMDAGNILFPLSYICGDVLTEVYGYRRARLVIWLGFACNLLAVGAFMLGQQLPAPAAWDGQAAYERILGFTPRLLLASVCGYLLGEFSNAAVLARLKVLTRGRLLWTRTIGSTLVGQGLDSTVFVLIAFTGVLPNALLATMILSQWLFKVAYEVAATPLTYLVVNALKRYEGLDAADSHPPRALGLGRA